MSDKAGNTVADLKPTDFEIVEDGKLQTVETFKLIELDGGLMPGPDGPPREIRNDFDEETEASRDDVRLFGIFLDDYHVRQGTSMAARQQIARFIETQLGPSDMIGIVIERLGSRRGEMLEMRPMGDSGNTRLRFRVPARGLFGYRSDFMTDTKGEGILHHQFDSWGPWAGEIRGRTRGVLVADRLGKVVAFALGGLQERATMFVAPGDDAYGGMIVGENSRTDDMDVNITKEKKLTNIRSSTAEETEKLIPPRRLSLEQALEFCREDECVEVTPQAVRLRKVTLDQTTRGREAARRKHADR